MTVSTLRRIREARGFSQPALAALARTSQQQIDRLEKGQRALTPRWARRLAPLLGVLPHELEPAEACERTPLLGRVGASEEVFFFDRQTEAIVEEVVAPYGEHDLAALRVEGDGLSPRYLHGELLFYSRSRGSDPLNCLYEDCVVSLPDGRVFLKLIEPGTEHGAYTLRSYDAAIPLLINRTVAWLAPVIWRRSRRYAPSPRPR